MRPSIIVLASALFLYPLAGLAQSPDAGPAVAAAVPASEEPADDTGKLTDPNIDRGVFFPTAETQPAGTLTISDYYVVIAGLTYGITDRLQLGVVAPLVGGGFLFPDRMASASLKWQVLRHQNVRLSLLAGSAFVEDHPDDHDHFRGPGDSGEVKRKLVPFGGLVGSICDAGCQSMVSANVHLVGGHTWDGDWSGGALYSVSLAGLAAKNFKLLLEYNNSLSSDGLGSHVVMAGARAFTPRVALELGGGFMTDTQGDTGIPFFFLSGSLRIGKL